MMLSELMIQRSIRRGFWRLVQPLVAIDYMGRRIEVPAGFETDGASIPRFLWRAIDHPFSDGLFEPAVIHDYLYQQTSYTREECDRIFFELMKSNRVPSWKRTLIWMGVRIGGHSHYGSTGMYILLALMIAWMASCTAHGSVDKYDNLVPGMPIGTQTVVGGLWKVSKDIPPPTKEELRREVMAEIDMGLARKGLRWASVAGILVAVCVALHLLLSGTAYPKLHRLAEIAGAAAAGSTVAACWQFMLMLAWYWVALAIVLAILVGLSMYIFKRRGLGNGAHK